MKRRHLILVTVALAGCGYSDTGSGTRTLLADVAGVYSPSNNVLDIEVDLSRGGAPTAGASIRLADPDTKELVELQPHAGGQNVARYTGELSGYHRKLELAISHADGAITAKLEAPSPHEIIEPLHGAIVRREDAGDNLELRWRVADGVAADEVRIELDDRAFDAEDTGKFSGVATSTVPSQRDPYGLAVTRTNRIALAGGVPASQFSLSYRTRSQFVLQE